jgi:hypothetical protein
MPRQSRMQIPGWAWPACLVAMALGAVALSWALRPVGAEGVSLLGQPLDAPCPYLAETGDPCPNCGFTRALMWAGRGRLWRAAGYHPGGAALMVWLWMGGVVGARRLVGGDFSAWRAPWQALVGGALTWMVGLYVGTWVLKLLL